jgi:hypothetical protein
MAGLFTVRSNAQLDAEAEARRVAEQRQNEPLITGLAAHLRVLWDSAYQAKKPIEAKMLRALRQRNGEYESDKMAEIAKQGGSAVFMRITETKCRGAESWLRDVLLDSGMIPFEVLPTPKPDLPGDVAQRIHKHFAERVIKAIEQNQIAPDSEEMEDLKDAAEDDVRQELLDEANETAKRMKTLMEDQFAEGGLVQGFNDWISDLTTYPNAFMKGPVVRRARSLKWEQNPDGSFAPKVTESLSPVYKRCDPYRMYPEAGVTNIHEGYLFEHHRLSRPELAELIGVPGYDEAAIRAVLNEMPATGRDSWLWSAEMTKAPLENKHGIWDRPTEQVDALEFWGKVPGSKLREWGMSEEEVPDTAREYDVNAWMIGRWVIKAVLNYDPLGKKPYYSTSFIKRPGAFWGSSIPEIIEDIQQMCNSAARALVNNMGLASGPMVEINIDRLPADEEITTLSPWRIFQVTNDPMGSGQPAIRFNQPDDRSQPLMMVYTHFLKMADDQSGIPAYVYGDMQVGGAGRTASGLSMLMGSAGKGIRQVVMYIDNEVIEPIVCSQFNWNMRYVDDPSIKGDCMCLARGAITLANREQLNVRRVEFLQATANPIDGEIVGLEGRAALLREVAKGLDMPVDKIIPSEDKMEIMQREKKAAEAAQQQAAMQTPTGSVQFQRDGKGEVQGANLFPGGAVAKGGQDFNTVSNSSTGKAA